jgi:DNA-binding MarR family transcriptional regulator
MGGGGCLAVKVDVLERNVGADRAHPALHHRRGGAGQPAGQTLARWLVLETIQDKPATVAQIARSLQLARQGVQRLANVLVRDSLAAYEDNPAHRRAKLLRITPQGRRALRAIQTAQAAWADTLGAEIGEAQLRQASILLDRVLQAVGRHPPDAPPTDSA